MRKGRRLDLSKNPYIKREGEKSVEDMLVSLSKEVANLKQEVADLRNQNSDLTNNIRKFAETAEQAEYKAGQALELDEKIEMCIDDIAMLDERTQELNDDGLAELGAEILRIIERRKRYGRQFY